MFLLMILFQKQGTIETLYLFILTFPLSIILSPIFNDLAKYAFLKLVVPFQVISILISIIFVLLTLEYFPCFLFMPFLPYFHFDPNISLVFKQMSFHLEICDFLTLFDYM